MPIGLEKLALYVAGQMSCLVVLERMQCRYIYMYSLHACIISIESRPVTDKGIIQKPETWIFKVVV